MESEVPRRTETFLRGILQLQQGTGEPRNDEYTDKEDNKQTKKGN